MTDALDTEIRRVMGELWQRASIAPTADELRGRERRGGEPRAHGRRARTATWATVAIGAVVAVAVVLPRLSDRSATELATGGPVTSVATGSTDVRLDDLVVSHVPVGFTLQDDQTENIPASLVEAEGPVPGSKTMVPQGSSGARRTQRYNRGDAQSRSGMAVIYVRVSFNPGRVMTIADLSHAVPNPVKATVHGKPAILSLPAEGVGGLVSLRWAESPRVVVELTARGAVEESEVRAMAEGITFPDAAKVPTQTSDASADGRLRRSYLAPGYRSDSGALGNFRVDPAPDTLVPQSTEADVLRAFKASEAGSIGSQPGTTTIARFGLFTGNVANPPASDGRLTGTHPVEGQPAWIILVDGVKFMRSGGADRNPDAVATTRAPSDPHSYAVTAVSDSDGRLLTGLLITGGSAAALGIN